MTIVSVAPLLARVGAIIVTSLALAACAGPSGDAGAPGTGPEGATSPSGELTIYAAASLTNSFDEIAAAFESEHPGITVKPIVYDGSSTLVTQLAEGAPADVFASADDAIMERAVEAGLVAAHDAVPFATSTLVIAVPAGDPAEVRTPHDLTRDDVTLVLCAVEVPCGAASQKLLDDWRLEVTPASFEQNVTAVLTKVAAGEADAGLVYRTDVEGRDDVEGIVPEGTEQVVNRYPIAALTSSRNPDAAAAFVAFVTGEKAQAILARNGFGAP